MQNDDLKIETIIELENQQLFESGAINSNIKNLNENDPLLKRITSNPYIRSGQPCVEGTRITLFDILSYLVAGMTIDQILDDFPQLKHEDIKACFLYCIVNL